MRRPKRSPADFVGKTVGRLTVTGYLPRCLSEGRKYTYLLCRCACGTPEYRILLSNFSNGERNNVELGCKCVQLERTRQMGLAAKKHGMAGTPEHGAWRDMNQRCHNPKNWAFRFYGGRGIFVADRWRKSFENFYADMGPRPSRLYSLDRIDNNGPYSPENCRWATDEVQYNNRRSNRHETVFGLTMTMAQWAKRLGVPYVTLQSYLRRKPGRTVEDFCRFRGIEQSAVVSDS